LRGSGAEGVTGAGRWRDQLSFVVVIVVKVERDDAVLLAKGPPPAEARESGEGEAGLALPSQLLHEIEDRVEGLFRTPVIGANADVAAELENRRLLGVVEARLLEHHHPLGLAKDVVVECALRYTVLARGLGEAHLLRDHGLDGLLELLPRPRRRLQLQQARVVS
jgi:hypothetical protein